MRALVFNSSLSYNPVYPNPQLIPNESLIRILTSGICLTDVHLMRGYMNFQGVLGHEFVGIVEQSDDPTLIGKRVVGEINAACHHCATCRRGDPTQCPHRTTLGIDRRDGVHADYALLPTVNLHVVPDTVSDDEAVFTEPLAAACEIVEQRHIKPTERVVVIGDGKLGLLVAQVLALTGCDLHVIGRHEDKLDILARRGITTEIVPREGESVLADRSADVVVECTGNPSGFATARRLVRPRGLFVLKSTYAGALPVDLSMIVVDEVTLMGSRCGPFAPALRLLEQKQVDVTSLISARYSLDDGLAAMQYATEKGVLKVLLER